MPKKRKQKFVDDGHTVYNMDIDGMPHRIPKATDDSVSLTKKEKNAMIKAALGHYLPIVLGVCLCFFVAMLIMYFWLK